MAHIDPWLMEQYRDEYIARLVRGPSTPAPSEAAGPSPVVGSGGVVGGRVSSAEAMALVNTWAAIAKFTHELAKIKEHKHDHETARRARSAAEVYEMCSNQLRRLVEWSNDRQPTPNVADQPRAGSAATPKETNSK